MAGTYEKISTYTTTSSEATVTFTSIPSTYTDLVIVVNAMTTNFCAPRYWFNNDKTTTNGYSRVYLYGSNSSVASNNELTQYADAFFIGGYYNYWSKSSNQPAIGIINVFDYAGTGYKNVLSKQYDSSQVGIELHGGVYYNTAAINRVDLSATGGEYWRINSTFTIYGIKAA